MQPRQNKWLAAPTIDPSLESHGALSRSTECFRHFILSIEFWISPCGRLRWWLKVNLSVTAWLFIPAVLLMPIISLVLHELDGWFSVILSIVLKLILLSILITVALLVIKHFPSSSEGSSRRRK